MVDDAREGSPYGGCLDAVEAPQVCRAAGRAGVGQGVAALCGHSRRLGRKELDRALAIHRLHVSSDGMLDERVGEGTLSSHACRGRGKEGIGKWVRNQELNVVRSALNVIYRIDTYSVAVGT